MTLSKIHHVALVVRDADAALDFFRDTLGLAVSKDERIEDQGVRGVLLPLRDSEIELIQPTRDDTGVAKFLESHGEGLHHICLESDDVAADLRAAGAAGMQLIDQEPRPGLAGEIGFIHPKSNHGVLMELAQPPAAETTPLAPPPGPTTPYALNHAVCAVEDPGVAAETFKRHFGFQEMSRNVFEAGGMRNALLELGGTELELASPIGKDEGNPLYRQLQRGEGMFMLSLRIRDASAAFELLTDKGLRGTDPGPDGAAGIYLSPKGTFGARIHLAQIPDA